MAEVTCYVKQLEKEFAVSSVLLKRDITRHIDRSIYRIALYIGQI